MDKILRIIKNVTPYLVNDYFMTPLSQEKDIDFVDSLNGFLDNYVEFYKNNLISLVDEKVPYRGTDRTNIVIDKIEKLTTSIKKTVDFYYQGKILEATNIFNKGLDKIFFKDISLTSDIPESTNFYRARIDNSKLFSKSDLFHIKFELRHIVSTNRFSIPGFPALYLGDTTYVCWKEYGIQKLRDLWFARFTNTRNLKVIKIQRIEDLLTEINSIAVDWQLSYILRYLITFPLIIACSIKVKHPSGNFKPEYIIPQLLLQYVSKNKDIDGIKFLSTKVDYSKLFNVEAYNYVFPVKSIQKNGFCSELEKIFHLTNPTSLELEEIIYNPTTHPMIFGGGSSSDTRQIEMIEGLKSYYSKTSFGKIEGCLLSREICDVQN